MYSTTLKGGGEEDSKLAGRVAEEDEKEPKPSPIPEYGPGLTISLDQQSPTQSGSKKRLTP